MVFKVFADASGPKDGLLSLAAYLFEKEKSEELHNEWERILAPVLKGLPPHKRYFHMAEYMGRSHSPYLDLEMSHGKWLKLRRDLIDASANSVTAAAVCSVLIDQYEKQVKPGGEPRAVLGGPLSMCGIWAVEVLSGYLKKHHLLGDVAYFFEAGDPEQNELETRLRDLSQKPYLREKYRYAAHSFVLKTHHHGLAVADMLAWEYRSAVHDYLRDPDSFKPTPFLGRLFEAPIAPLHFSEVNLGFRTMAEMVTRAKVWAHEREMGESEP